MNVNKKFDRFKQWGRERMGSEVKTDNSEDFKMLELEMSLRQEGESNADKHLTRDLLLTQVQVWSVSNNPLPAISSPSPAATKARAKRNTSPSATLPTS